MAARAGPRKIHRYTAEFKLKAVKLTQIEGIQVKDVGSHWTSTPSVWTVLDS